MGRPVLTTADIDQALADGQRQVQVPANAIVTQLAREYAQSKGVQLASAPAEAAAPAMPASSAPREPDHSAVRAAVVKQLGEAPTGLDAAITKVLGR